MTRDLAGFQNRAGGLFFTLVFHAFTASSAAGLFIGRYRACFAHEIKARYYGAVPYVWHETRDTRDTATRHVARQHGT